MAAKISDETGTGTDGGKAEIRWVQDSEAVSFAELADLLNRAFDNELEPVNKPGWEQEKEEYRRKAKERGGRGFTADHVAVTFRASYAVEYAYDGDRLIAAGRVLSDGIEQAAIYNVAVDPGYQGLGLGRDVIRRLIERVPGCEVILYTHPQTVKFYETLGFRRQKTGFVTWAGKDDPEAESHLEKMGFLLPKGFRYGKTDGVTDESDYYVNPHAQAGKI